MRAPYIFLFSSLLSLTLAGQTSTKSIFVLARNQNTFEIERIVIPESTDVRLPVGTVSPILPIGPGQSGDIIQGGDTATEIIVRNTDGGIEVEFHRSDGSVKTNPPVALSTLRSYDIRVNVIAGTGLRKAFVIEAYETVRAAGGPVIDLFRGMIPLKQSDVSTTLVTTPRTVRSATLEGEAPLTYSGGLIFTSVRDDAGDTVDFIVDFGAGATVVSKEFLPEGLEIRELIGVERSEAGDKIVKGSMGAAGGDVESFLGQSTLNDFEFGTIHIPQLTVNVVSEIPSFDGRRVGGIIGMNILQLACAAEISYEEQGKITLGRGEAVPEPNVAIAFSMAARHIFIEGKLDSVAVSYLFDTGARFSIISEDVPGRIGATLNADSRRTIRGLDGRPVQANSTSPIGILLGDHQLGANQFVVADLPVLRGMGLQDNGAILGNDVLSRFSRIRVDFEKKFLYLWE